MHEKAQAAIKSQLPLAILASVLFHVTVVVIAYFTHDVAAAKRNGSSHNGAVIKVTLVSVSLPVRIPSNESLQAFIETPTTPAKLRSLATITTDLAKPVASTSEGLSVTPSPLSLITYYPVERLTKRPQPTSPAQLEAPEISPLIASGRIVMKLWISEWGSVNDAVVENSDLPSKFSDAAIKAMKQVKFTPGEFYGRKVAVLMKIEIRYDDFRAPPQ